MLVKKLKEGNNGREMEVHKEWGCWAFGSIVGVPFNLGSAGNAFLDCSSLLTCLQCREIFMLQRWHPNHEPFCTRTPLCVCMCPKSLQSCLNLCNPMDGSLPGSSVHRIFQARILGLVATSSSKEYVCICACLRTYTTLHKTIHIEES